MRVYQFRHIRWRGQCSCMRLVRLVAENGSVLCERGAPAAGTWRRTVGLIGRRELAPDEGLGLATSAVHTFGMRFAIDVVFCDAELRVLKVVRGLRPGRVAGARGSRLVFELAAGAAADVHPGDRLSADTIEA